jgi:hypothetical protein
MFPLPAFCRERIVLREAIKGAFRAQAQPNSAKLSQRIRQE